MSKKLEETFNVEDYAKDEELYTLEIPDEATLDDVSRLALEAYKAQMEQIASMEPKYRSRAFEVAQHYLSLVKDAITKKADLEQKQQKLDQDSGKNEEKDDTPKTSRKAILTEINRKKRQENEA